MVEGKLALKAGRQDPSVPIHGDSFAQEERRILEGIATGGRLEDTLTRIARLAEREAPGLLASILILDATRLLHGAAPSLPKAYCDAIHGIEIGPGVGSCGTAAATGKRVIVEDVQAHPYWEPFRALAGEHGLRACWSTPILGHDGKVVGTFAIYHREPRGPLHHEEALIANATHLASLAIQHDRLVRAEVERRAEEAELSRLREILYHAPIPVALVTLPEFRYIFANPAYATLVGRADLQGKTTRELFPELEGQGIFERLNAMAETGVATHEPQMRVEMDRGHGREEAYFSVHTEPYRDHRGEVVGLFTVALEVTAQVRSRQEVDGLRASLAQSEKMSALGQLVSGVAHEIRTPLTYLATNLNLVQLRLERMVSRLPREEAESSRMVLDAYVPSALEAVDRINHLVGDLRAFTQTRTQTRERCDLAAVVAQGIDLFRATHRGRVAVRFEPAHAASVDVDRIQIQQALLNLLQNAMEAEPRDHAIVVSTSPLPQGGGILLVKDTGKGIPPAIQARVFDPFFTTRSGGTGLGLSIVKRVADEHGGSVTFDSDASGTTFRLVLPAPDNRVGALTQNP